MSKRVVLGMSGGVDSTVAASILKGMGYEVLGVYLDFHEKSDPEAARDAARSVGIPFESLSLRKEFSERVISPFVESYLSGKTPNPCVMCNPTMKFFALNEYAVAHSADYIATGHYADTIQLENGRCAIKRPIDPKKDQTYVLYRLPQHILSKLIFPLNGLVKPQVREIAQNAGFKAAQAPDSMEICFVEDDYKDFLAPYVKNAQKGNIFDTSGNVVGTHNGIFNYTVGQRKGLGLSIGYPCYVISVDEKTNTVVVGHNEELFVRECRVSDTVFSIFEELKAPAEFTVRVRYKSKDVRALVTPEGGGYAKVEFETPVRAVTPGQSAVFYDSDILAGGGIIV